MESFTVTLGKKSFRPGELISGEVTLGDTSHPATEEAAEDEELSVRLIWFTSGKGDRDYETVDSVEFPSATAAPSLRFQFVAPHRPLSFAGKLISLQWAVEAVLTRSRDSARCDFDLSDQASKLQLEDKSEKAKALNVGNSFLRFDKN